MNGPDTGQVKVSGQPKLHRFSDIELRQVEWLWPCRIPIGKITGIAGEPGLGKSLITVAVAAAVTSEAKWPDCGEYAPHGSVILLSGEDDNADTVLPRLIAAGADTEKVFSFDSVIYEPDESRRGFTLDRDIDQLAKVIKSIPDCRLLVIDPISAFMGKTDSHKNSDVRGLLSVLADLAQETQVAVVFVSHLNKGQGSPMSRVTGSGAFVAAARSGMLVGRDPADPDRKIIAMLKANLSKECKGVAYRIGSGENDMPIIEWEPGFVDIRPEDILNLEGDNARRERSEAVEWLCVELSHGPVNTTRLQSLARESGHAWRTVQRAQKELKVRAKRTGNDGSWQWWPPDHLFQDSHVLSSQNVGEVGDLQDENTLIDGQDRQDSQDSQYRQDIDTGKVAALSAKANP